MKITISESQYQKLMEHFVTIDTEDLDEDILVELWENEDSLELTKIVIPQYKRNRGLGGMVMNRIIEYSNDVNKPIYLTPDLSFGATSISRLKKFYKRFGFEKNNDLRIKHTMVRYPN
jgi:predicted GNAT family N-acyltransferase